MWKGLIVLVGATLVLVAVWLRASGRIAPYAWKPAPSLGPAGAFAVNEELLRAEHLPLVRADRLPTALGTAPESAVFCNGSGLENGQNGKNGGKNAKNGALYTGLEQGTIVRMALPGGAAEEITNTGGRPLGLACDKDHLYIADAKRGLLSWSPQEGLKAIAKCPGDKQPYFTDAVAVEQDTGRVWFTCPTERWSLEEVRLETLEAQPTGRLLTWKPPGGEVEEKLSNLGFANGVAVDPQGRFVLVSEYSAYRIRRLWLKGEKKGKVDTLFDNLPGYPDNLWIDPQGDHILWVGFPIERAPTLDRFRDNPHAIAAISKLPEKLVQPPPHGWLVGFDLEKKLTRDDEWPRPGENDAAGLAPFVRYNLHDPSGALDQVTGAVVVNKDVYISSLSPKTNFVARWRSSLPPPEYAADPFRQGWKDREARIWHETPQGVDFFHIRYDWFVALERLWSEERFANATFLSSLGFVYDDELPGKRPEEVLPIGMTKLDYVDQEEGGKTVKVVGTTCALCHTGRLQVNGQRYRVEGGQAMHSIASTGNGFFVRSLTYSMLETSINPFKFDRFARRVLCPSGVPCDQYPAGKEALRRSLRRVFLGMLEPLARQYQMSEDDEGPGRIDAFGHIANTLFGVYLKNQKNVQEARAPVDIANVWDTWRFDWVQWTSTAGQAMGRNVGEASFGGNVRILDRKGRLLPEGERFGSAILVPEIYCLETTLEMLQPPRWPPEWGARDEGRFAEGRRLFHDKHCFACHGPHVYAKEGQPSPKEDTKWTHSNDCSGCHGSPAYEQRPQLSPKKDWEWKITTHVVGTDGASLAAQTSARYDLSSVQPGAVSVSAIEGLNIVIAPVVDFQYDRLRLTPEQRSRFNGFGRQAGARPPCGYHARPLHGIWATPPFLHNGSVRSVYELLLPEERRAKRFWIGPNQEYDVHKLGFTSDQGPGSVEFDTTRPGNGNMGHNYGTDLSDEERFQLLEYLKFLGDGPAAKSWPDDPDGRPSKPSDLDARFKEACHRGLQGPAGELAP